MKKFLGIVALSLLTYSCTTTEQIISEGGVKINMSKAALQDAFLESYPSDNPFLPEGGSEFFADSDAEIIWGFNEKMFYVFQYVSEPISCGIIFCRKGNGSLKSWFNTIAQARADISEIKSGKSLNQNKIIESKKTNANTKSESQRRKSLIARWNDPGYTEAGFPQPSSFWIFIKNPPNPADKYAALACHIAKTEYSLKGFTISVWDFNKKKYGMARCY